MKKNLIKVTFFLSMLLLTLTPLSANAAIVDSGTYEDNITWIFDDSGTLTISGTGDMSDSYNEYPWHSLKSDVNTVIIKNGVTSIGYRGFYYFENMTSIDIPDSIKIIGEQAFDCCSRLTSINIPDGVATVKNAAFRNCYRATEIIIADSVTTIEPYAFANCNAVESIYISSNISVIEESVFSNCRNLTTVSIPLNITEIKQNAFTLCPSISSVMYAGSLEDWGKISIRSGNDYLINAYESSNIPEGSCGKNLTWELNENGVLTISGTGEMYDFNNNDTPWKADISNIKEIIINDGITKIGKSAFADCRNLTVVKIPNTVTVINNNAFNNCYNIDDVFIDDIEKWCAISFSNCQANPLYVGANLYLKNELVENLIIPDSISEIGKYAFYGCKSISKVTIPASVTSEYVYTFDCCYNLQEINVDSNNTKYCSIDGNLFSKDETILYQYSIGKKDIIYNVPDGVVKIGDEAFFNCTNLQYIVFPDSLTTIGNSAFNGCSSLVKVKLPNNITEIRWYAFSRCTSLKSITIPKTITKIYDYAFNNCTSLSHIYYNGIQNEWNNIEIGTNNAAFINANVHFIYTETEISQDGKIFIVTPINVESGKTVILALYDKNKFLEVQSATYVSEALTFTTDKSYKEVKVMVWNSLSTLTPVCDVEIIK